MYYLLHCDTIGGKGQLFLKKSYIVIQKTKLTNKSTKAFLLPKLIRKITKAFLLPKLIRKITKTFLLPTLHLYVHDEQHF